MSNSNGAREFPVETDFQKKARRPGGVTRNQAIGGAQAQIETLKEQLSNEEAEITSLNEEGTALEDQLTEDRANMSASRAASRHDVTPLKPTAKTNR